MSTLRTCPRCGQAVDPPTSAPDLPVGEAVGAPRPGTWNCPVHAWVVPVTPARVADAALLTRVGEHAQVPLWLPATMPAGWAVTGVSWAGDDDAGAVATVLAVSGPHPIPEAADGSPTADLVLVAEQPGVGLGARLAGLPGVDAGPMLQRKVEQERAEAHVAAAGHEVPVWSVGLGPQPVGPGDPRVGLELAGDGGIGFVGEAAGVWLWLLAWPATTAALLLDGFALVDARDPKHLFDLTFGPLTARLR